MGQNDPLIIMNLVDVFVSQVPQDYQNVLFKALVGSLGTHQLVNAHAYFGLSTNGI